MMKENELGSLRASSALDSSLNLTVDPNIRTQRWKGVQPHPQRHYLRHRLPDGTEVSFRAICSKDEPLMIVFHQRLSPDSVHFRYFNSFKLERRICHDRLKKVCLNNCSREIAMVAERCGGDDLPEILGVGRIVKCADGYAAEFAIVVRDDFQNMGLGTKLLDLLVEIGREEGIGQLIGYILRDNYAMKHICRKAGFRFLEESIGELTAVYTY